ncbi:WS/DGAT/MGAT family O-acyltransferase [Kordiimonas aquimaris]|uniref:WS/DGAT/MGAT family O-acyltransferase n=1 Tax=Kordiimonas aquimaris TaxID=707591 RepID=UPI0021CFEE02|nr:wax ester/triacylglycerol synthase family O-acyltransferase [Kordiimonas aquimaris]
MHKLSGMDATFLYMETDETPMHIASLLMCEPAKDGDNPYEALKSQIASRIHEIPSFHRKLMHTPFYIDHPVWVSAGEIDMDYHIKHARLPAPGTVEQLRILIQGLHSATLDRDRPLWQFYIIEGVEDPAFGLKKGSFAVYSKGHHAGVDGGAGISAMDILSDRAPTPRPPLPNRAIRLSTEKPGFFELLGSAYGKFMQQQADVIAALPALSKAIGNLAKVVIEDGSGILKTMQPAPKTRFNVRIQKQRAYGAQSLSLSETIALAKRSGTSLNDVVMSVCGGALRRYFERHNELPARSLVAGVPVSLRELGDTSNNNQVAAITCEIGTDVSDPLERLRRVNENAKRSKKQLGAVKEVFPTDFSFFGAPVLVSAAAQFANRTDVVNRMPAAMNVVISNVPGPRRPMYFAGSKVIAYFPVSIATHGSALNITLQSYVDRLDFGLIACKIAVPDVQDIADDIVEEFALLRAAIDAQEKVVAAANDDSAPKAKKSPKSKASDVKPAAKTVTAKAKAAKPADVRKATL